MFNFLKKKQKDPLEDLDKDRWLKELLIELNLNDMSNLLAVAKINKEKLNNEELATFLKQLQPIILSNLKEGRTSFKYEEMPEKQFDLKYKNLTDFSSLKKFGIFVNKLNTTCLYGIVDVNIPKLGWFKIYLVDPKQQKEGKK